MRARSGSLFAVVVVAVVGGAEACGPGRPQTHAERASAPATATAAPQLLTGPAALGDFTTDAPGVRRRITIADLPAPFDTPSVDNGPQVIARPEGAWPRVPDGFRVERFAEGLTNPRMIRTAPNGDLFVVESKPGRVKVLRRGAPARVFADGLTQPFGVAFHPPAARSPRWIYVADTDSVVRFPYASSSGGGAPEVVVADLPSGGRLRGGGHWTRDIAFSLDGARMWISVGSRSNDADDEREDRRARILEFTPDGRDERVYASGIRNAVGLAVHPETGDLWASVNERDGLGDHLVPDYVTRVRDGGFYGWPWFYLGANEDPAHAGAHPDLRARVLVPDVLLQSHSASLGMTFYDGASFPPAYRKGAFAAEHGSWNRARRTGYKVVFVPVDAGVPRGEYVDFMTGFVTPAGDVWGRSVAVAVAADGSLFVSDDGGDCIWRVAYGRAAPGGPP